MTTNPTNYTEFWDFYVSEHSLRLTRVLHFVGTSLGIALLVFFIARGQWYYFPVMVLPGWGILHLRKINRQASDFLCGHSSAISR